MKRTHKIFAGLVSVASLALGTSALAFPGDGMGPGGYGPRGECGQAAGGMGKHGGMGMGMGMGMRGGMGMGPMHGPAGFAGNPAAAVEARLAYLKTDLKITSAQETAWNAFATNARKQAEGMQGLREKMRDTAGTAPDRLAQHTAAMKQRVAAMEGQAAALKDLYAALSADQKALLDQHFAARGPGRLAWGGPAR